ncbi:MAG: (2Fe-2S) ferredoxin domain-containing protein [Clostridia bacterium]
MKSIAELQALREKAKKDLNLRNTEAGTRIIVGMATCGIASGARPVMTALVEELAKRNLNNCTVAMTGCLGLCKLEPLVEVIDEDGTKTTYIHMTAEKARRIIVEHIVNGQKCKDLMM